MPAFGSIVGQLIGGEPKIKKEYYDETIRGAIPDYAQFLSGLRDADLTALSDYEAAIRAAMPDVRRYADEDVRNLGALIGRNLEYDPLTAYERIRSGNLGALGRVAGDIAGYGSAADSLALARLGYGGRGPRGSYENILRTDRVARNIAPVVNTIFGNLGRDTSGAAADRLSNILSTVNLMGERTARPLTAIDTLLRPVQARQGTAMSYLDALRNLGGTARENVAGFRQEKSKWQLAGEAGDELVNTYLQLYGMGGFGGAGGGSMGGILGGIGGGGGGGTKVSGGPGYFTPTAGNAGSGGNIDWGRLINAIGSGSAGGGGGFNLGQILTMLYGGGSRPVGFNPNKAAYDYAITGGSI